MRSIVRKIPQDMDIGVIAIAGEFRKGKSFLMNFFLQYLSYRANSLPQPPTANSLDHLQEMIQTGSHPWLRDVRNGFKFRSGVDRDTSGIVIWSEPLVVKNKFGDNIAVLLMDSQGLYDSNTGSNDNVRIFTIVSLLSSSLLLNTPQNVNLRQLIELKYFMNYATMGSAVATDLKPFQRLTFLIRDYTLEEEYGWSAGQQVLNRFFNPSHDQPDEVRQLAHNLTKGFSKIDAYALPLPGPHVIRRDFDGSLQKIDPLFLHYVERFVTNISETLEVRQTFGSKLTAGKLLDRIEEIVAILNAKLPPDELMKMNDREAVITAFFEIQHFVQVYERKMQEPLDPKPDSYYLRRDISQLVDDIYSQHQEALFETMDEFDRTNSAKFNIPFGGNGTTFTGSQWLRRQLEERFKVMLPQLRLMTETKRHQAEVNRDREAANDREFQRKQELDDLKRRIEEARKRYEQTIKEQNQKERDRREKTFWEQLFEFFKHALSAILTYMAHRKE